MSTSIHAPIPNLSTIVRYASSKECWNHVLGKHYKLIKDGDQSGKAADEFYQHALLEWGAYWEYYDLLNVTASILQLAKLQNIAFLSPIEPGSIVGRTLGLLLQHPHSLSLALLQQSMVAIDSFTDSVHTIVALETYGELFQSLNTQADEPTLVIYEVKAHQNAAEVIEQALSLLSSTRIIAISGLHREVDIQLLRLRGQQHDSEISLFAFREEAPGIAIVQQGRNHLDG